jgi:hypothetical protein
MCWFSYLIHIYDMIITTLNKKNKPKNLKISSWDYNQRIGKSSTKYILQNQAHMVKSAIKHIKYLETNRITLSPEPSPNRSWNYICNGWHSRSRTWTFTSLRLWTSSSNGDHVVGKGTLRGGYGGIKHGCFDYIAICIHNVWKHLHNNNSS